MGEVCGGVGWEWPEGTEGGRGELVGREAGRGVTQSRAERGCGWDSHSFTLQVSVAPAWFWVLGLRTTGQTHTQPVGGPGDDVTWDGAQGEAQRPLGTDSRVQV